MKKYSLKLVSSFTSDTFRNLNAMTVIKDKKDSNIIGLYTTNFLHHPAGTFPHLLELYGQQAKGSIAYCETSKTKFLENKSNWKCSFVATELHHCNGIELSANDEKLYVAETLTKQLLTFRRDLKNNTLLIREKSTPTRSGCDNIRRIPNKDHEFLLGCQPKIFHFMYRELFNPSYPVPSRIILFNDEQYSMKTFFESDGTEVTGCSGAILINGKLAIASADDALAICDV